MSMRRDWPESPSVQLKLLLLLAGLAIVAILRHNPYATTLYGCAAWILMAVFYSQQGRLARQELNPQHRWYEFAITGVLVGALLAAPGLFSKSWAVYGNGSLMLALFLALVLVRDHRDLTKTRNDKYAILVLPLLYLRGMLSYRRDHLAVSRLSSENLVRAITKEN